MKHVSGGDVFAQGRIGALTLRNRILKAATYEGLSDRSRVKVGRAILRAVRGAVGGRMAILA